MIPITRTFLPPLEEYQKYLERIWATSRVTTNGELAQELAGKLRAELEVDHLLYVANGTAALQIALEALEVKGDVITTPFSYVATASSIAWTGRRPVFADIDPETMTLDPEKVKAAITPETTAILATHVYGIPCQVEKFEALARDHGLKIIYDGAHAYGCRYKGKPLASYGDACAMSFQATKLFHTVEGGAVISHSQNVFQRSISAHNQGHLSNDQGFDGLGINAKNSEFHAAMGLCMLPYVSRLIAQRKSICEAYDDKLQDKKGLQRPKIPADTDYNYPYYPLIFPSEKTLLAVQTALKNAEIYPRRYFHPSLTSLPYVDPFDCPIAEDFSRRVLCLPLSQDLEEKDVQLISDIVLKNC